MRATSMIDTWTDFQFIAAITLGFAVLVVIGLAIRREPIHAGTGCAALIGGVPVAMLTWILMVVGLDRMTILIVMAVFAALGFITYVRRRSLVYPGASKWVDFGPMQCIEAPTPEAPRCGGSLIPLNAREVAEYHRESDKVTRALRRKGIRMSASAVDTPAMTCAVNGISST